MPGGGAPFSYIPPSAIQNAMMTKDKKPFTYTPGGIDFLAEIRSPRMQRRISKNAADEGVASHPQHHHPTNNPAGSSPKPNQLSPQALMAMQPQMAVPVFPPTPQQMPVLHSPVVHHSPVTSPTPAANVAASPLPPPPPPMQHNSYQQQPSVEPQPMRINLKPAVPQFLQSQPPSQQSPEQMFEEIMNSLTARNANSSQPNQVHNPSTPAQPSAAVAAASVPTAVPFVERRNAQVGSLYIPPVNNNNNSSAGGSNSSSNNNGHYNPSNGPISPLATAQLAKAPMPWMNSQNRTSNSPTPTFVHQQQERVIPVEREEEIKSAAVPVNVLGSTSGNNNVRLVPIMVEGGRTGAATAVAPPTPQRSSSVRDETVHPPWHNAPGKVIPIHMEIVGPGVAATPSPSVQRQQQPDTQQCYQQLPQQQQQQQQAPWRTQAAANANQIASMMEE